MFKTNEELIEKQKQFWDEDLRLPGDSFSSVETFNLEDIVLDKDLLKLYQEEEKDQQKIKDMAKAIESGVCFPPLLLNEKNELVDGYHRVLALLSLSMTSAPVIFVIQVPR